MTLLNPSTRITLIAAMLMAALTVLALAPAPAAAADDADKDWKVLGDAQIEKKGGTAEIKVGGEEGLVKRIKFEVRGTDVEFKKVTITYENGDPEQVDIRDKVRRGGKSRTIDLKGGNRVIKKVLIAFKLDKEADRDARIVLMGHK
jgi:ABC-type glycerol-3-phosphate transport system substrate-binding protein